MTRRKISVAGCSVAISLMLAACGSDAKKDEVVVEAPPKNVIFFLGDGMGLTTMTAARIYSVGEDGALTMDTLPETAFVKTFSNDAQVTDSAPSMAAYMTGVKMNNEVISMSANTVAIDPGKDANGNKLVNKCGTGNGTPATTLLELAKAKGFAAGVVSTARVTHATPAATYAHICHRDLENDIAAALVPGGTGYNSALGTTGLEVVLGGGAQFFTPFKNGGKRSDDRDLVAELKAKSYTIANNATDFKAVDPAKTDRLFGVFTSSHMSYDLDRDAAKEPSLAEMTTKAMDVLAKNKKGYFLMVEGGRIDHALHETTAKKALQDTVAFDNAIKAAIEKAKLTDPTLANTLIVVTADHDHTLAFNGYGKRGNPILDINRGYKDNQPSKDEDGNTYTTLVFGNGPNRPDLRTNVDSATALSDNYLQETGVRLASETHGGGDVKLLATGAGAKAFKGTLDNTKVFDLLKAAFGF